MVFRSCKSIILLALDLALSLYKNEIQSKQTKGTSVEVESF
jgi:hypothetical protein